MGGEGCRGIEGGRVDEAATDAELVQEAGESVVPPCVGAEGEVGLVAFGEGLEGGWGRQRLKGAVDVVAELVRGSVVGKGVVAPAGGRCAGGADDDGGLGAGWAGGGGGGSRPRVGDVCNYGRDVD